MDIVQCIFLLAEWMMVVVLLIVFLGATTGGNGLYQVTVVQNVCRDLLHCVAKPCDMYSPGSGDHYAGTCTCVYEDSQWCGEFESEVYVDYWQFFGDWIPLVACALGSSVYVACMDLHDVNRPPTRV